MARITPLALLLSIAISFTACKKDKPKHDHSTASLTVRLTDDPADYDAVNIDVQSVEIHSNNGGWILLNTNSGIYNLLDLTNGVDTLLANGPIPAGTVSQVRLKLGTNNTIVVNGVTHPLEVPSAYTSGLKINIHQTVAGGMAYTLLLDFDAGHSIVEQNNGQYKLKPVIHGQFVIGGATGNTLTGVVMPPASNAFVSATNATDTASTYINGTTGQFLLQYLNPGTYTIWINTNSPYNDTVFTYTVTTGANVMDTVWVW